MSMDPSGDAAHRAGAAALAMLAGMAVGLTAAWLAISLAGMEASFARFVFGGAAAGSLTGFLFPAAALYGVEAILHFFIGVGSVVAEQPIKPEKGAPRWVSACLVFGVVFALALWVLL